eukprot:COSAG01_NODE_827_length_13280_cov_8.064107_3_plen_61_part_00
MGCCISISSITRSCTAVRACTSGPTALQAVCCVLWYSSYSSRTAACIIALAECRPRALVA